MHASQAAENECPCIVYELPVSMAGEGEWYNSQQLQLKVPMLAAQCTGVCRLCAASGDGLLQSSIQHTLMVNVVIQPTMVEDVAEWSAVTPTSSTA